MTPTFQEFLRLTPEEGLDFVRRSPDHEEVVREGMGERAFAEYVALAGPKDAGPTLDITPDTNLLFLPGIMGSSLESEPLGGVWWLDITNPKAINQLGLSRDGLTDANPADRIRPLTTDHRYTGFLTAARDEPGIAHDRLPYDWRKSLRLSTEAFRERIGRIHETNGGQPVHVVAHSMGGVLTRVALMAHGDELWPKIGRIAFIGTPHYGSPAIGGYLKHHFWGFEMLVVLAKLLERTTFRTMRGALGLLPAPKEVYPGTRNGEEHPCANFDLYDASAWHLDLDDDQAARLQEVLHDAAALHRDLLTAHDQLGQDKKDRMLVVAGVGYKTLFRLEYQRALGFLWKQMVKVTDQDPDDANRLGDGRVPVASAALEHVGEIRYVRGVHAGLPNIPAVYRDVFHWLKEESLELPTTPKGALSQTLAAVDTASITPVLDGSNMALDGDPGYLDLDEPDEASISALVASVESGDRPEFRAVSIL